MKTSFNKHINRLGGMVAALGLSAVLALPLQAEGPSVVRGGSDSGGSARGGSASSSSSRSDARGSDRSSDRSADQHRSAAQRSIQRHIDDGDRTRNSADRYPNEQYRGQYSRPDARGRDAWPRGGMQPHPYMNQWQNHDSDARGHDNDRGYDRYRNDYRGGYYYRYNDRYYDGYYPMFAPIVYYSDDYVVPQPVASYDVVERQTPGDVSTQAGDPNASDSSEAREEKGHYEEVATREVIDGEFVEVNYPAVFREDEDGKLIEVEKERTVKEPKIRIILKREWVGSGEEPARGEISRSSDGVVQDTVEIIKPDGTATIKPIN